MSSSIQVFARFRPPNDKEVDSERHYEDEEVDSSAVTSVNDHVIHLHSSNTKTNEFSYSHNLVAFGTKPGVVVCHKHF